MYCTSQGKYCQTYFECFVSHSFLPNDFSICSSVSTADASSPLCFFQLMSAADEPWINICLMGAGKEDQHHRIKLMLREGY